MLPRLALASWVPVTSFLSLLSSLCLSICVHHCVQLSLNETSSQKMFNAGSLQRDQERACWLTLGSGGLPKVRQAQVWLS